MGGDLEINCNRGFREKLDLSEAEGDKHADRFKDFVSIPASVAQGGVHQCDSE